jgi:membrane-bound lytic murein transglycosylase B
VNHRRWLPPLVLVLVTGAGCADDGDPGDPTPAPSASLEAAPDAAPESGPDAAPRPPRSELPPALAQALAHGPRRARTPGELAAQVVAAERAIADPSTAPDVLAAAGHLQQLAYRVLGARPVWDDRVLRAVPDRLMPIVTANARVRREFRSMHSTLSDTLPAWRIVRPAPAASLESYYREAERRFGVGWEYLAAINLVETGMGRIRGTSVAGAQGPMQFIPGTWDQYGRGDINSPHDAIMAAGRYIAANGFARPGGRAGAIYRYNNHPAYVRGVTLLAQRMERDPRAFLGYYHWQIYYLTVEGDVLLPEGYHARRPIPVRRWLAEHPQR